MAKRTPAAQARRNKQRGSEGEREVCTILSDRLGRVVQRRLGQARDGGGDVLVHPFVLEIKRRKRIGAVYSWFDQATKATGDQQVPAVLCRGDGKPWLAIIHLDDFIALMRESLGPVHEGRCGNCKVSVAIPHDCPVMAVPWVDT